ncbi:MAG: hypothetical protein SGPRY_004097, partial [Prymnesium sp.]
MAAASPAQAVGVLLIGTGEYSTGFVNEGASSSDKPGGVLALVALHLRSRGLVTRVGLCGVHGAKLPAIRAHMQRMLGDVYTGIDPSCIETFPADHVTDAQAYRAACLSFSAGDVAIIFTPDDTHAAIASCCLERGMHVLITKPPVKTLHEHAALAAAANEAGRLCCVETPAPCQLHKRFDPIYLDARDRIQALGDFSFFSSYMSQPKLQLHTFKAWAGTSSDISYYLNSHHVDFHAWAVKGRARPEVVSGMGSTGVASARLGVSTEDTITLAVQWRNRSADGGFTGGNLGHASYTASWVAPKSDAHSQQRWFYMGHLGEVSVDQAHRGYQLASDAEGYGSLNPLFWKPTRDATTGELTPPTSPARGGWPSIWLIECVDMAKSCSCCWQSEFVQILPNDITTCKFSGQRCYGYLSIEAMISAAISCNDGVSSPEDLNLTMPTLATTTGVTAILE